VDKRAFDRIRKIVLALPEVNERLSHGEPCFFIQNKRPLCYYHDDHNGDGRVSLWCPVPDGVQEALVRADPDRFFAPPTSASGVFARWLGIYLDTPCVDWHEVTAILSDSYRVTTPKKLAATLERPAQ
jgi:hypothetical protein